MIKVIVVEDERMIREGIISQLPWGSLGIECVLSAENGETALSLCNAEKPDIIISDIRMRGMNGIELCAELTKILPSIQIIFMSGYDDKEYLLSAINLHAVTYIEKPVDPKTMEKALLTAVNTVHEIQKRQENSVQNPEPSGTQNTFIIRQMMDFIDKNFDNKNLATQMVSDAVYLTPSYTSSLFKKHVGITITQYIQDVRMKKAEAFLKDPRYKIYQIAALVGYDDSNYFARLFKKNSGLNPSEYRDRYVGK